MYISRICLILVGFAEVHSLRKAGPCQGRAGFRSAYVSLANQMERSAQVTWLTSVGTVSAVLGNRTVRLVTRATDELLVALVLVQMQFHPGHTKAAKQFVVVDQATTVCAEVTTTANLNKGFGNIVR